jgi:hypothetical protein
MVEMVIMIAADLDHPLVPRQSQTTISGSVTGECPHAVIDRVDAEAPPFASLPG